MPTADFQSNNGLRVQPVPENVLPLTLLSVLRLGLIRLLPLSCRQNNIRLLALGIQFVVGFVVRVVVQFSNQLSRQVAELMEEKKQHLLQVRIDQYLHDRLPAGRGRAKTVRSILRDYVSRRGIPEAFMKRLPEPIVIFSSMKQSEGRMGDHICLAKVSDHLRVIGKRKIRICLPDEPPADLNAAGSIIYMGGPLANAKSKNFLHAIGSNFKELKKITMSESHIVVKHAQGRDLEVTAEYDLNRIRDFGLVIWHTSVNNQHQVLLAGIHSLGTVVAAESILDSQRWREICVQLPAENDSFACLWEVELLATGIAQPKLYRLWAPLRSTVNIHVQHAQSRVASTQDRDLLPTRSRKK